MIYVLEDEEDISTLVADQLEGSGYEVKIFSRI